MKYGRTKDGERWHAMRDDETAMCFDRKMQFVELRDGADVAPDDRCGNCDGALREAGATARKAQKSAVTRKKSVYEPRHRFKE